MSNQEYQNKIISLLGELANVFKDMSRVLDEMIYQSLDEDVSEDCKTLRKSLQKLIDDAWNIIDALKHAIKSNVSFEDLDAINTRIQELVQKARRAKEGYEIAERDGLLNAGLVKNKEALLDALVDISNTILEYNAKHTPKLKTLKAHLIEDDERRKEFNKRFYEEIFHEKLEQ